MTQFNCPGAGNIKGTPTLQIKCCPNCGAEVEIFSTDIALACPGCGFQIYNDAKSCVQWCRFARECIGEELYQKFKGEADDNGD